MYSIKLLEDRRRSCRAATFRGLSGIPNIQPLGIRRVPHLDVWRILSAKSAPLPGKTPIPGDWDALWSCLLFLKSYRERSTCKIVAQKVSRRLAPSARSSRALRSGLFQFVRIPGDAPGRVDAHVELFFL